MSDEWIFFPCQMGEHPASIFYDHGIRESIDGVAPQQLLKVRVAFKEPRADGMPTNQEFQQLTALEDDLCALVQQHESIYAGRVTVNGHRHFYIYTSDSEDAWASQLDALGRKHGYSLALVLKPDENHEGYWQELFPTDADWQVIQDLRVLETLEKQGDDGTVRRQIDHWAYFPSQAASEEFSQWAREQGYILAGTDTTADGKFRVRFGHEGTVELPDITSHTIALQSKASELGGDYDGWETQVCKPSG
jgi:uncharacterized protein DUF695/regulator of ribonuclease activity B